jgi:hypothetical protein
VGTLLAADPDRVLTHARRQLDRLRATDTAGHARPLFDRWGRLIEQGPTAVHAVLVDDSPESQQLRQASPFAGLIDPRQRWAIWREVRRAT